MKDADLMTPEELRELADQKENDFKPIKEGVLKDDLYAYNQGKGTIPSVDVEYFLSEIEEAAEKFKLAFEQVLPKGAKFEAYLYDGQELWYDCEGYGIEAVDSEWAADHLENIREIK